MAIRDDFTAGEVLAAADLNDTFASKVPYAYGTATPSTTVDGFVWFDENSTPPAPKFWDGAAFQGIGGGKILQVIRDTDTTSRTTTSTSFVDLTGVTVTITPQKSTSAILLIVSLRVTTPTDNYCFLQITDASNNAISGAEEAKTGGTTGGNTMANQINMIGYATPGSTAAVTYKVRFRGQFAGTQTVDNNLITGQMYAIEVAA